MEVRLDLVGVVTADMAASLDFYRRLGLPVPEGSEGDPHVEASTPGGLRVAWDTAELVAQIYPNYSAPSGGHRVSLAFLCHSPTAVDEKKYEELSALGHGRREPWDAFWGQRYAVLEDPDGNHVDLFAPL